MKRAKSSTKRSARSRKKNDADASASNRTRSAKKVPAKKKAAKKRTAGPTGQGGPKKKPPARKKTVAKQTASNKKKASPLPKVPFHLPKPTKQTPKHGKKRIIPVSEITDAVAEAAKNEFYLIGIWKIVQTSQGPETVLTRYLSDKFPRSEIPEAIGLLQRDLAEYAASEGGAS